MPKSTIKNADTACVNAPSEETLINALITKFLDVKTSVEHADRNIKYLMTQDAKLTAANWILQTEHGELQKKAADLKELISRNTKVEEANLQERADLQAERTKKGEHTWKSIQNNIAMYAKKFYHAQTEYAAENLTKDIEKRRDELEKMNNELAVLQRELEESRTLCDPNNLQLNDDTLTNVTSILVDKSYEDMLMQATKSKAHKLHKMQTEIKEGIMILSRCSSKASCLN